MSVASSLSALGFDPTPLALDVFGFDAAVRTGNLVFISGQVPEEGETAIKGRVGDDVDPEVGCRAAAICAANCVRAVGAVADIESIVRVVKVFGMVNVADGFDDTPGIVDGASRLFDSVFGEAGRHARSAVGVVVPHGWAVEVEAVFELRD